MLALLWRPEIYESARQIAVSSSGTTWWRIGARTREDCDELYERQTCAQARCLAVFFTHTIIQVRSIDPYMNVRVVIADV